MTLRIWGSAFILFACSSVGIKMAAEYIRVQKQLQELIDCLHLMSEELQYRFTPLPELCQNAANLSTGSISRFFIYLRKELESQVNPDVKCCVNVAVYHTGNIPEFLSEPLLELGNSLGQFDMDGQVRSLNHIIVKCTLSMERLNRDRDIKLRNFRTLGMCAGAAIVILLM